MMRAIALRDFAARRIAASLLVFAIAGVAAGLGASMLSADAGGSIGLITGFDRTLIGITGWVAVFRTIHRLGEDASSDWLLQLTAAGASRELYATYVALSIAASLALCYTIGAGVFAAVVFVRTLHTASLTRVVTHLPLVTLPILAASAFGSAVACVFARNVAARVAFALMAAPWIALWITIAARGELLASASWLRLLEYPVPRLYVVGNIGYLFYMVFYIAAAFAVVMATAQARIGKRA